MFTRRDFSEYITELRAIEKKMAQHYSGLVDEVEDDELRLRFASLMQCENRHARALDDLIEIGRRGTELAMPQLKWTIARKTGGLILLLLLWMLAILAYSHTAQAHIIKQFDDVRNVQIPLEDRLREFEKEHLKFFHDIERSFVAPIKKEQQRDDRQRETPLDPEETLKEAYALSLQTGVDMPHRRKEYSGISRSIQKLLALHEPFSLECAQVVQMQGKQEVVSPALVRKISQDAEVIGQRALELSREASRFSSESMEIIDQERAAFIRNSLSLVAGGIVVGALLAWLIIAGLRRTFHEMAEHAREITEVIISDKIPEAKLAIRTTDEASILAYLWNIMIAALGDNLRRRQKLEREIELTTSTDRVTGVMNRREGEELLGIEVARAERYGAPLSIIFVDVDHFMAVNETHGPEIGDSLIAGLAHIMQKLIRECDMLCRYGGGEFFIITTNTDANGAAVLAEKVRSAVQDSKILPAGGVTVSLGVAQWQSGKSVRDLIRMADSAMVMAKKSGRNRVQI